MAKSLFTLYPGLAAPKDFVVRAAPPLLAQQDLWESARVVPPSLLFRVRTESDAGAPLSTGDRLESCIGLVDSATRWRCVFRMAFQLSSAVRHPALTQAIGETMQFFSTTHPASLSAPQRSNAINRLMQLAREGDPAPAPVEQGIAASIATLIQADNDVEAAHLLPFPIMCPFDEQREAAQYAARMGTIETMTGATLIVEAATRLAERMPAWMFSQMPELKLGGEEEEE